MRTLITFLMLSALAGCELYTDEADDAAPDAVAQCHALARAFCDGATACGYSDDAEVCAAEFAERCDINETVIPEGVVVALEVNLRGRACDGAPTWNAWIAGDDGAAVLGAMIRW